MCRFGIFYHQDSKIEPASHIDDIPIDFDYSKITSRSGGKKRS